VADEQDFLAEVIEESTALDSRFPQLVESARKRRELIRALVAKRKARRLSQTTVAARMHTSQSAVARLEAQEDAKESMIDRYAAAIGVEVARTIVDHDAKVAAERDLVTT
jgi:predicted transcriptional regulator